MTYAETLEFLYTKLPLFSRMGSAALKKDLTNTRILCDRLDNPQDQFKTIHIAGTNGKGSVSHMLAAILQQAGYKTGLYTSPHLHDFRERIRINGELMEEAAVVDFVERTRELTETIEPSFFELTVAMAFDYFARQQVDVAVIEVGLGGRLDSTNIISPELSVITNIGLDHVALLGNTLAEIAAEKGGIIKEHTPVVIGEKHPETAPVFTRIALEKAAPLFFAEDSYSVTAYELTAARLKLHVADTQTGSPQTFALDLPGVYQKKNILSVLKAVDVLKEKGWQLTSDHLRSALQQVKSLTGLHGRWEVMRQKPTVVLEVAHNEDGMRQMLQHLQLISYDRLHLVFGMVKDKDITSVLKLLPKEATYYFTQADIPRALDGPSLQAEASVYQLQGETYANVNDALGAALSAAGANDLILVCGSIFLVAEVSEEFRDA
ncbi:folylpolyglutamate synthase/dihydrofolate synthase family protein [Paraflavisolibacter sp. H34]|uniref:bifunctional folylpolyglutamate synthase/dihydrofolate synthase n=1 Tax=Huijunlia imazamoxiresistens TaxID=3127457 RepID=UPI003019D3C4